MLSFWKQPYFLQQDTISNKIAYTQKPKLIRSDSEHNYKLIKENVILSDAQSWWSGSMHVSSQ